MTYKIQLSAMIHNLQHERETKKKLEYDAKNNTAVVATMYTTVITR